VINLERMREFARRPNGWAWQPTSNLFAFEHPAVD
jgi:hypothetical protein